MFANVLGRVCPALLFFCSLLTQPLLPFTIIKDYWTLSGSASGQASLLLYDFPKEAAVSFQEKLDASYDVSLNTHFYLDNLSLTAAGSYQSKDDKLSLDQAYLGWGADFFDISLGRQRTVWGFGNFFHPAYALDLKDEKNAKFPVGATLWSAIVNIPLGESQLNLLGYLENEFLEANRAPGWGGGSVVLQNGVDVFGLSFSGSVLGGTGIKDKIHFAAEMNVDLGLGCILTASFGNLINLESGLTLYRPLGLLGVVYTSSDAKQHLTLEGYYDEGLFLASRLNTELLSKLSAALGFQLDMENRGFFFTTSVSHALSDYLSTTFNLIYLNGRAGSRFDNRGAPLMMELSFGFNF